MSETDYQLLIAWVIGIIVGSFNTYLIIKKKEPIK